MLKRRLFILLLLLALLAGTVSAAGLRQSPYAIRVNRALNTVTIYGLDENGQHTVPVKAMICSTARPGYVTPLGTYRLIEYRSPWRLMLDGTYGQYATCFSGHYLFHSICYSDDSHDAMIREAYNALGTAASMGCVRLETADAKWIYDNCPAGTVVTIYDDPYSPGPLGKPEKTVDEITLSMYNGWDPTDPAAGNPWQLIEATSVTITPEELTLTAGEAAMLEKFVEPEIALSFWTSSDEAVAKVDRRGTVTALSAGTAEITLECLNGMRAVCTVQVEGELLPFSDLIPGAWYYPEVRLALENGLFSGGSDGLFAPNSVMTRAMVVQVLYNLAGRPETAEPLPFEDVAEDAWYRNAVAWAVSKGIVTGVSAAEFAPDRPVTRQDLATILWRYAEMPEADANLTIYTDSHRVSEYAAIAMGWMTEQGLMNGSNGQLLPQKTATRAETAAILQRYAAWEE